MTGQNDQDRVSLSAACACHEGQAEHYANQAQQILTDLSHYEAVHPKDAPCLLDAGQVTGGLGGSCA